MRDKSLSGSEVQYGSIESLEQLRTYQEDFCSDGELEITNTEFKCIKPFGSMLESDEEITFEGGIVTMTFPLRSGKADDMDEQSKQMQPIIAASFAGQFVNLRITAKEILETNGTISEDGKTASIRIPLDAMIMDTLIRKEFYVKAAYKQGNIETKIFLRDAALTVASTDVPVVNEAIMISLGCQALSKCDCDV